MIEYRNYKVCRREFSGSATQLLPVETIATHLTYAEAEKVKEEYGRLHPTWSVAIYWVSPPR